MAEAVTARDKLRERMRPEDEIYVTYDEYMRMVDIDIDAYRAEVLREAAGALVMTWGGPDHDDGMEEARVQLLHMAERDEQ